MQACYANRFVFLTNHPMKHATHCNLWFPGLLPAEPFLRTVLEAFGFIVSDESLPAACAIQSAEFFR